MSLIAPSHRSLCSLIDSINCASHHERAPERSDGCTAPQKALQGTVCVCDRYDFKLAIISLICMVVCAGCQSDAFQRYRREGMRLMQEGRYSGALGCFEAAREMVPEHADNLCDVAHCHVQLANHYLSMENLRAAARELDSALSHYQRAVRSYPGYARALQGKNEVLELQGKYTEALRTALWASTVVGPSLEQQLFLAREYAERGDADAALLAYQQAVAMEPNNPVSHWSIGMYYLQLDRKEDGIEHLRQAYVLDPTQYFIADELIRLGATLPEIPADRSTKKDPSRSTGT